MRAASLISPLLFAGALAAATGGAGTGSAPELLRWHRYAEPVFPLQLANTQVLDGFAHVVFTFDDSGRVTDRVVTAASHPAFAVAVLDAVQQWQIDTRELARPIRREALRFDFHRAGAVIAMTNRDAAKGAFSPYGDSAATAIGICRESELDRPLQPSRALSAAYPPEFKGRGVRGRATLGFIVDAAGRVRVPAVTDATEPAFGEAALKAARQWSFSPAQKHGFPVLVLVERTVIFNAGGLGE